MEESVGTVVFDGRFWVFLLEKTNPENELFVGKYTFGPEPTNTDLLDFYLYTLHELPVHKSDIRVRRKANKRIREQERITAKAKNAYKESQKKSLEARERGRRETERLVDREKYALKRAKAKEKRRGH